MQLKGKLIKWDNEKAFGFIAPIPVPPQDAVSELS
jgi:hypothetical protein